MSLQREASGHTRPCEMRRILALWLRRDLTRGHLKGGHLTPQGSVSPQVGSEAISHPCL